MTALRTAEAPTPRVPEPTTTGRLLRWVVQGHVLLALVLIGKLMWFHSQLDVPFFDLGHWVVTVGTVVLLTCWLPLLPRRTRFATGLAISVVVTVVLLSDLVYYRFFDDLLTIPVLSESGQAGPVSDSIWALVRPTDPLLFIDVAVALAAAKIWGIDAVLREAPRPAGRRRPYELVLLAAVVGAASVALPVEAQRRDGEAFEGWWNLPAYQATGLLGFHVYDAVRYLRQNVLGVDVSHQQFNDVQSRLSDEHPAAQLPGTPAFGEYQGSNVLVVQVEALQEMAVGAMIDGQRVTPHLDRLIGSGIYFPDFHQQTGAGHTADAELLAGCSIYPAPTGAAFHQYAQNTFDCLPQILGGLGYSSAVHHAYKPGFWNRAQMYQTMGYDRFFSLDDFTNDEPLGWTIGDRSFFRQTVAQLKSRRQPFYDLAITLTSHYPYSLPNLHSNLDVGDLSGTILGDYLQAIHYTDSAIGVLVRELKQAGLWDDTIVLIYGDHDSAIYDPTLLSEFLGNSPDDYAAGSYDLSLLRDSVPLIMHLPDGQYAGQRMEQPMGQIDVAPTLLHLLGVPAEGRFLMGVDRFTMTDAPVVFRDGGYVDARHLFVPSPGKVGDGMCYARLTGAVQPLADCQSGAETARDDLRVSDLVLEHDLIPRLRAAIRR